jgi:hypothetical protein
MKRNRAMLAALLPDFEEWSFRMISLKKALSATAFAALMATGALVATAVPASAYLACNHDGDCWHTESRVHAPGVSFDYHPDDWYFHQKWDGGDRHYRDYHEGRGYYKGGVWITL